MKFVHIADMHFDTPFITLSNKQNLCKLRRIEQRETFRKMIEYIKENEIPYLFISGDLYEHKYIRESTIEYYLKQYQIQKFLFHQETMIHILKIHFIIILNGMKM